MKSENKRFKEHGDEILQYGEVWAVANCPHHADIIATGLNELNDEIEQLKSLNNELRNELKTSEYDYKVFNEVINKADELISEHLSEYYQRKWRKFCEIKGVL